ncbi:MAG: hypothetical protein IPP18_00090 [Rhodocyclaceae bacterium]|jgi:hypothetical protein|nr:hypothetical protein [Rhodocyclaceae bacterium]MBK6554888.1 hypothetical protein [Rhodocyclaceae bacterium]MBK9309832.1 hypothetical protein [Rhodocyclaceae bacterium]MBK9953605.1 hypothetical protein [Rhodocyclaceae bacterium]
MAEQNDGTPRGTEAHAPDLAWSQVRETVLMLELAAGQVDAAMRDSNASVNVLTESFTAMAGLLDDIDRKMAALGERVLEPEIGEVRDSARQVAQQAQQSVIAFQFYDRLVQRLDHVCHSLASLSELVNSPARRYNPSEWAALQQLIASKYTMVEERAMFDAVMRGVPVKAALEQYMAARMQEVEASGGDIELF